MKLIVEDSGRHWLNREDGLYILDLVSERASCWDTHLLENIKVFKTEDGSYIIKADEIELKYFGDDFRPVVLTDEKKELVEIPQTSIRQVPEIKGFLFWKKPTGKTLTIADGYCKLKKRKPFCLRIDTLTIKGVKFCEELG